MIEKISQKKSIDVFVLSIFAILINYNYGSLGVLPQDTFAYFDTSYRVLKGSVPFIDYWTVSGPFIDFFQAGIFNVLGVSWKTYILSGCLVNLFITVLFYLTLNVYNLSRILNIFYSICFSLLANPSMGTPFPDHFSSFFSLAGILLFLILIKKKENYYWLLIPLFFFISFFSKQTPGAYLFVIFIFTILLYIILFKKIYFVKYFLISSILCVFIFLLFLYIFEIDFELFLDQYILFPQTIGSKRIENLSLDLNLINQFKFLLIPLSLIILNTIYIIIKKEIKVEKEKILINFSLSLITLSFIFHQTLTMNFIFIFFLIPLICGFIHINLKNFRRHYILISFILISFTIFTTIKYHFRFNEDRKMLNLERINLSIAANSNIIDKKLSGLKWITRTYYKKPNQEIEFIKFLRDELLKEEKKLMLYSDYLFLSAILEKDLNTPTRWPSLDDASNPSQDNPFHQKYITFVKNLILTKKIDVIYSTVEKKYDIFNKIFDKNCRKSEEINEVLTKHDIRNCKKI